MKTRFIVKDLKSELMLYDTERDEVHILNATAGHVYRLVTEGKDLNEIERVIRKSYRFDPELSIAEDIRNILDEMERKGLIQAS